MTTDAHVAARLAKLITLALSSDNEGEVLNAIAAVRRWMKRNKRDPEWVLQNVGKLPPVMFAAAQLEDWPSQLDALNSDPALAAVLSDRELEFTLSLIAQRNSRGGQWAPTPRQKNWLGSIYMRARLAAPINN